MPNLGYEEEVVAAKSPVLESDLIGSSGMVSIDVDTIPFKGSKHDGIIECKNVVVDAFRAYSVCELKDGKGDVLVASGWVVDIDPLSPQVVENAKRDARVKYFISVRSDFAANEDEFKVSLPDLKEKIERVRSRAGPGDYVRVNGYIAPWDLYLKELSENPEVRRKSAEVAGSLEEELREIVGF